MKTFFKIFSMALVCLFATPSEAQNLMSKGTKVIQAGAGVGGWSGTYTSQTPILSGSFAMGIIDDLGPGNLAVGATVGYKHAEWNYWSYNYTFIAPRATWHPNFIQVDKLDTYAGVALGVYRLSWDAGRDATYASDLSTTAVAWSFVVGGRYYFTENLGVYAELGAGLGWLNAGVAYKF